MTRKLGILVTTLSLIASWSVAMAQQVVAPPRDEDPSRASRMLGPIRGGQASQPTIDDVEFGQRVAGSFLGELHLDGEDSSFFHFVMALHADGTVESSDSGDNFLGYESPSFGVWRRTAPRQLTIRQVYLRYDRAGNLVLFGRDTLVADFDEQLRSAIGTATGEALAPSEVLGPLDPNAGEATLTSTSNLRMNRLEVDVAWGSVDGNDVSDLATPIDCPSFTTKGAAIDTFDDVDFYVLAGNPGEVVQIDIDTSETESRLDTILGAFDSDLMVIAQSDDDPAPGETFSFDSYVATTMPVDGVLYIAVAPFVYPYGFEGPGYSIGSYTLNVDCGSAVFAAASVSDAMMHPKRKDTARESKPKVRFRERYASREWMAPDGFGRIKPFAGTYLAVESGFFGTLYEIITLHMDGTFSVQFEGSQEISAAAVRGDCRRGGRHLLICEGLDRLVSTSGRTVLFDRISWVFDFDPALDGARGYQVTQELFHPAAMLNPPRPNAGLDDEDFVTFGFGNELPSIRQIEVPVERRGKILGVKDLGYGQRIAGTFLGIASEDGRPPGEYFLARIGADGTVAASDTSDYLFGQIDGAMLGSWERTGPRSIEIRSLGFLADEGDIVRNWLAVEFSEDLEQAHGSLTREFFLRPQVLDPPDPNTEAPPVETRLLEFTMRRLVIPEDTAGK